MKIITYQGMEGAFSHITAIKQFGENCVYTRAATFRDACESVEKGEADYAVIPIENSLVGSIYENYDLLNQYDMVIVGENYTKIEHCLLTVKGNVELKTIKKVLSHPKALEQCAKFFERNPWIEAIVSANTATAASEVAKRGDPSCGAIASEQAAKIYGLEVAAQSIQDDPANYTRFITIAKNQTDDHQADKCSLLFRLKHEPGSLASILDMVAGQGVNLTKIESRPLRGSPFEYIFYADFEFDRIQEIKKLLTIIEKKVQLFKMMGFYKRGSLWTA